MRKTKTGGLRTGEVVEVTVEKGVYRGLGLARHGGQVVLVSRGLPGDRLRARIESVKTGYARAAVLERLGEGPGRRRSPCPYVPRCGGCSYQELSLESQHALKVAVLRESLARAGAAWEGPLPLVGSPEAGWRMRASFHLQAGDAGVKLGLHEEGTHRVVDLERCLQVSDAMNRAARSVARALGERLALARRIRSLELAESADGSGLVAALEGALTPEDAPALAALAAAAPELTGLGFVARSERGPRFVPVRGDPYVRASVLGVTLRSHVLSFFQANRFLLDALVGKVVEGTPAGGTVLDLYAGVGLFALPLAARAERVLAAEWSPTAVEDLKFNAQAQGAARVSVEGEDVSRALLRWPASPGERVILDPPRGGAGGDVVRAVAARQPESVVYVSCDPPTLGRDLRAFAEAGYRPRSLSAFDLFPDTFHVEAVAALVRA